jgi:hypothetical protein
LSSSMHHPGAQSNALNWCKHVELLIRGANRRTGKSCHTPPVEAILWVN